MDATLYASPADFEQEVPPGRRYGLLAVAVAAALLGLTVLDVDGMAGSEGASRAAERSTECIVASAVFVGVAR